jgi:hypothetical protein
MKPRYDATARSFADHEPRVPVGQWTHLDENPDRPPVTSRLPKKRPFLTARVLGDPVKLCLAVLAGFQDRLTLWCSLWCGPPTGRSMTCDDSLPFAEVRLVRFRIPTKT